MHFFKLSAFLITVAASMNALILPCKGAEWLHVGSSVFDAVKYDPSHQVFVIRDIRGRIISFHGVPGDVYMGFMDSEMKGGFFKGHIHGKYEHSGGDRLAEILARTGQDASASQEEAIRKQSAPSLPPAVSISEEERVALEQATFAELVGQSMSKAEEASHSAGLTHYAHEGIGILGRNVWFFDVGSIRPGDEFVREVDDSIVFITTGVSLPVTEHLAFSAGLGYAELEGTVLVPKQERYVSYQRRQYRSYYWIYTYTVPVVRTRVVYVEEKYKESVLTGNVGFTLSLLPGEIANPFVGAGAFYSDWEATLGDEAWDDSGSGWIAVGGVELNPSANLTIVPAVSRSESSDSKGSILSLLGVLWVTPRIGLRLATGYETRSSDRTVQAGLMAAF